MQYICHGVLVYIHKSNMYGWLCPYYVCWWPGDHAFLVSGPVWGKSTSHRWIPGTKGQWCGALMLLMLAWISCWTNTRGLGDLRRHEIVKIVNQNHEHITIQMNWREMKHSNSYLWSFQFGFGPHIHTDTVDIRLCMPGAMYSIGVYLLIHDLTSTAYVLCVWIDWHILSETNRWN